MRWKNWTVLAVLAVAPGLSGCCCCVLPIGGGSGGGGNAPVGAPSPPQSAPPKRDVAPIPAKGRVVPGVVLHSQGRKVLTVLNVSDYHVERDGEPGYPAALVETESSGKQKWVPLKELDKYTIRSDDPALGR